MRRFTFVFIASVVGLCAVAAQAEHTRFWQQSSFEEFDKGTKKGMALRSDGTLMPAPEFKQFADPNLAYIWALAVDSKGRLYAAGGSDAKVLRLAAGEKPATVFQSAELEAQALAIDKQDNLYVATSPDGKVYKVTSDGQHSVFFDPKTKYIWALAFNPAGTLFVATGDTGEIFAVAPDGKGQLFYKCDETHARSLAFDQHGNLLVGTDPSGLVIRVPVISQGSGVPKAGKAFVIYETAKKEVTALTTDSAGDIYAAAVGNKAQRPSPLRAQQNIAAQQFAAALAAAAQKGQHPTGTATVGAPATITPMIFPQFPSPTGGAEVYRISPDGSPESLWSSPQDVVYTLAFSPDNHLLLGTGNHGDVIQLDDNRLFSSLANSDASQVTALIAGPGHTVYAATANPGKVFTLGPSYAAEGTFESDPFDAKIYSRWGRLSWWGQNGADGKVEFYVRSGNTSDPDDYWSAWSGPYTSATGSNVGCPPARFVQWKAVFHVAGQKNQPTLSWVKLAYLRKNVAPVIDGIAVQDPGIRAQGFEGNQEGPHPPSVIPLHPPRNPQQVEQSSAAFAQTQENPVRFTSPPQGIRAKGYQTVVWTAHDENDDELIFSVYYRGQGEKEWKLLKDNLHEDFYSWDTTSMPDGAYYLKIVASDAPSNPVGEALTAEMESDRFEVDNTPPTIENIRAEQSPGEWHVRFVAHDSASAIARTSYSLDAGKWQMVFPFGQLTDAPSENYDVALRNLKPGEHTVAVRVFDEFENTATGKVTFTVGGSAH
jgi:sugar lactone lactonase YvrE